MCATKPIVVGETKKFLGHGSPSGEIIPPYGMYIAGFEFTLICPIVFGNVLIIVSVCKFRRLQVYIYIYIYISSRELWVI